MDLSNYAQTLRQDLSTAAALGDENTRRIAEALAGAAENSARLMLLSALSDLAGEISEELGDRTVHVRLDGTRVAVEVARAADTEESDDAPTEKATKDSGSAFDDVTGDISRVTLRLVEQIKARAEESAAQNGVSLNSWIGQAVQGALRDQARHGRYGL
ncbi:toxin-antitoxin system HicB family antitoxin [Rhodococcus spelaei]|uniref:Toxin-antitoxin system HicB family antitoxin n=1 Tax=Rhodococcus spelaei TaxID=2546320 RepID=A0A541AZ51_9NOCA|nr:toxin-antitoxin system HicB family antitoxin [Rhodococcus spelaei]TQF65337.1 toxin-antitoxin system HicB family antitoxin [Rhodococcus spelaei]